MLINEVPKEKITSCMEQLSLIFSPINEKDVHILKQGLTLYRDGAVYNAVMEGCLAKAVVLDDTHKYNVEIHLDNIKKNNCECTRNSCCTHQLATLFYLFSFFDSPGEFFSRWKTEQAPLFYTEEKTLHTLVHLQNHYDENSLSNWIAFFNNKYQQYIQKRKTSKNSYWNTKTDVVQIKDLYDEFYPLLLDTAISFSPFGKILFRIHAAMTVFEKILELAYSRTASTYNLRQTQFHLQKINKDLQNLISQAEQKKMERTSHEKAILSETPQRLLDIFFHSNDYRRDRFFLFQLVTSNLTFDDIYLKKIKETLLKYAKDEKHNKQYDKTDIRLTLAHIDFLNEKDQEAISLLQNGNCNDVIYYTTWYETFVYQKKWDRFQTWLPLLKEKMTIFIRQYGDKQLKKELTFLYLDVIKEFIEEKGTESMYIEILQTWLPYSYDYFNDYLLDIKDYKKWTELQLFAGMTAIHLDLKLLNEIEKRDRSCLLPLYHHTVEECIALKSRSAYRDAVKYLRKLRKCYRHLKKEDVWNRYIQTIAQKYKRLRAFQEELRKGKGKLINDETTAL